jgi:hypothetical protein
MLKELLVSADTKEEIAAIIQDAFIGHLQQLLRIQKGRITGDDNVAELGVDSLAAVDIRAWIWKSVGQDVAVMKVLGASSIAKCKLPSPGFTHELLLTNFSVS